MKIGIEKVNLYTGPLCTDAVELAVARGQDRKYAIEQLMVRERSVIPPFEDAVTLAVNAVRGMLSPTELKDVELLIVSTESAVDFAKPVSTWVHRYCELPSNCRNFEVKHACYGGTAALKMAAMWVAAGGRPGKKALVVSTDITRPPSEGEGLDLSFLGGGCAIAMLVGANPRVFEIDPSKAGYWTNEIADAFRPNETAEVADGETSVSSYLDALDGAFAHYTEVVGPVDYASDFKKHIYHAPFPGMMLQSHRSVMRGLGFPKAVVEETFQKKVRDGIHFATRIGTAYGSSTFAGLMGHLTAAEDLGAGDRISIFAYGSGCQGEMYHGTIGAEAKELVRSVGLDRRLDERGKISIDAFVENEKTRKGFIGLADFDPLGSSNPVYDAHYAKRDLLVLKRVQGYFRSYELT